jgi:hypothetical protein
VIVTNGATRPARPDGFVPLALDAMVADLTVQAWHDPGCTWLQQDPDRFCRWLGGTMRPPPAPRLGAGPPVTAGALRCLGDAEAQEP